MPKRSDDNQVEIMRVLRQCGATVESLHTLGKGIPDLLVGKGGVNLLVEVKDGRKPPSRRKLTEDEERWHATWRGQVVIVESVEDAIQLVNDL